MSSLKQCKSQSLFQILTVCDGVWYILVTWFVILVGYQNYGNIMVASFCKPEIGICIVLWIVIKLVLLLEFHEVGCCMICVSIMVLTMLNDGMVSVSAQCGCCQHFRICINIYAL